MRARRRLGRRGCPGCGFVRVSRHLPCRGAGVPGAGVRPEAAVAASGGAADAPGQARAGGGLRRAAPVRRRASSASRLSCGTAAAGMRVSDLQIARPLPAHAERADVQAGRGPSTGPRPWRAGTLLGAAPGPAPAPAAQLCPARLSIPGDLAPGRRRPTLGDSGKSSSAAVGGRWWPPSKAAPAISLIAARRRPSPVARRRRRPGRVRPSLAHSCPPLPRAEPCCCRRRPAGRHGGAQSLHAPPHRLLGGGAVRRPRAGEAAGCAATDHRPRGQPPRRLVTRATPVPGRPGRPRAAHTPEPSGPRIPEHPSAARKARCAQSSPRTKTAMLRHGANAHAPRSRSQPDPSRNPPLRRNPARRRQSPDQIAVITVITVTVPPLSPSATPRRRRRPSRR